MWNKVVCLLGVMQHGNLPMFGRDHDLIDSGYSRRRHPARNIAIEDLADPRLDDLVDLRRV